MDDWHITYIWESYIVGTWEYLLCNTKYDTEINNNFHMDLSLLLLENMTLVDVKSFFLQISLILPFTCFLYIYVCVCTVFLKGQSWPYSVNKRYYYYYVIDWTTSLSYIWG